MSVIKKLIAGMSLATLLVSLGGCLPFMAVRAAKTVSDKANSSSDADAKKAQDANKPAGSATAPATAAPAATPAK
ncbi:MAG: hypothetical protein RLZ25_1805 [Pseudomonadota bacterium]|jgi:hypothetical protein